MASGRVPTTQVQSHHHDPSPADHDGDLPAGEIVRPRHLSWQRERRQNRSIRGQHWRGTIRELRNFVARALLGEGFSPLAGEPIDRADAVLCVNMVHISPWASALGLIAGAARVRHPSQVGQVLGTVGFRGRAGSGVAELFGAWRSGIRRRKSALL